MTFVVIPHGGSGDLSTRSYEISYRRLRMAGITAAVIGVLIFLLAASWVWVAAQAARVPVLKREVAELQRERQERERLARQLARMQATYEQIRVMLRGDLPPLDSIEARANAAGGRVGGDSTAPPPNPGATDTAGAVTDSTSGGDDKPQALEGGGSDGAEAEVEAAANAIMAWRS